MNIFRCDTYQVKNSRAVNTQNAWLIAQDVAL